MSEMVGNVMDEAIRMDKANVKRYHAMLPQTRQLLQEFYRPYNQRLLEAMGGDDRWLWGY
jgi:hypothetical protein